MMELSIKTHKSIPHEVKLELPYYCQKGCTFYKIITPEKSVQVYKSDQLPEHNSIQHYSTPGVPVLDGTKIDAEAFNEAYQGVFGYFNAMVSGATGGDR